MYDELAPELSMGNSFMRVAGRRIVVRSNVDAQMVLFRARQLDAISYEAYFNGMSYIAGRNPYGGHILSPKEMRNIDNAERVNDVNYSSY